MIPLLLVDYEKKYFYIFLLNQSLRDCAISLVGISHHRFIQAKC